MKRIIRLTESDLTRIVKRVISEDAKSIPNVSPDELTFSVIDNKGNDLYLSHKKSDEYSSNGYSSGIDIELTKNMFEYDEEVTIEIEGGFKCTSAKLRNSEMGPTDIMCSSSGSKSIVKFLPSMTTGGISPIGASTLGYVVVFLTGNIDYGNLILNLNFNKSTLEPKSTNESYRRRYRRY